VVAVAADRYRRFARIYDRVLEPMNAPLRGIGLTMFPPTPGMRVLDVGCGTGTHLELYLEKGCRGYGIDNSPAMLEQAHNRLGDRAELKLGNATDLPHPDGSFDLVIAATLLHELDQATQQAALAEMARVMADNGRLLVIDFHAGGLRGLKGWLLRGLSVITELVAGLTHYRHYRGYIASGGPPAIIPASGLAIEQEKVVAGGNIALYLLH
jgi:ubiquinone/menaquinone biosynthesis C-methylase UbiE